MMSSEIFSDIDNIKHDSSLDVCLSLSSTYEKMFLLMEHCNSDINSLSIFQEGKIMDDVKRQGQNLNTFLKVLSFIPRLVISLIRAITGKLPKDEIPENRSVEIASNSKNVKKGCIIGGAVAAVATVSGCIYGFVKHSKNKENDQSEESQDDIKEISINDIDQSNTIRVTPDGKVEYDGTFDQQAMTKVLNDLNNKLGNKNGTPDISEEIQKINELTSSNKRLQQDIDEVSNANNKINNQLKETVKKLNEYKTKYENLSKQIQSSNGNDEIIKNTIAENNQLRQANNNFYDKIKSNEEEIKKANSQISRLSKALTIAQEEVNKYRRMVEIASTRQTQSNISQQHTTSDELRRKQEEMQNKFNQYNDAMDKANDAVDSVTDRGNENIPSQYDKYIPIEEVFEKVENIHSLGDNYYSKGYQYASYDRSSNVFNAQTDANNSTYILEPIAGNKLFIAIPNVATPIRATKYIGGYDSNTDYIDYGDQIKFCIINDSSRLVRKGHIKDPNKK